jgi:hypothetical protein
LGVAATDDLDILDPPGHTVTVAGQPITIKPLTIGQLPRFARAIQPAWPQLAGDGEPDWLPLVAEHGEALIVAAAVATGIESKDIEAMAPDEFVLLWGALFATNMDFFLQRLAPAMKRASDRIVAATARIEAGATPSRLL